MRDPDRQSPPKFNLFCQWAIANLCEDFMQMRSKVANRQTDKQTNNDENITALVEKINISIFCILVVQVKSITYIQPRILWAALPW